VARHYGQPRLLLTVVLIMRIVGNIFAMLFVDVASLTMSGELLVRVFDGGRHEHQLTVVGMVSINVYSYCTIDLLELLLHCIL